MKDQFYKYIETLQDAITTTIEELDGVAKFKEDIWKRDEGGGGKTRVIENGAVLKKEVLMYQLFMVNYQKH